MFNLSIDSTHDEAIEGFEIAPRSIGSDMNEIGYMAPVLVFHFHYDSNQNMEIRYSSRIKMNKLIN